MSFVQSGSEATKGDYMNHLVASHKEMFERATANNEPAVFSLEEKVREQNQETIKWKDLPTCVIYKILEVLEVDGKFGKCKIFTLKDRQGETIRVWVCPTPNK